MPKLPAITGREAIRAFEKVGFEVERVVGSHHVMKNPEHFCRLSIPVHGKKELKSGTLRRLIRDAGLTVDEFRGLL